MEVATRVVSRNRCSCCRQEGHNRTRCPHDAAEATSLRDAYNRERREFHRRLVERALRPPPNASLYDQVQDLQARLTALRERERIASGGHDPAAHPDGPSVCQVKIQEILFENAQQIPDGLYKELMDALMIRN